MTTLSAAIVHSFQNNNAVANNSKKNKKTFTETVANYLATVSERIYEARMEEVKMRAYYRF